MKKSAEGIYKNEFSYYSYLKTKKGNRVLAEIFNKFINKKVKITMEEIK